VLLSFFSVQIEHSLKLRLDRLSLCRYSDYADDVIGLLTITCTFEYLDLKQLIPKLDVQCIEIRMSIIFYVFYFFSDFIVLRSVFEL